LLLFVKKKGKAIFLNYLLLLPSLPNQCLAHYACQQLYS